MKQDSLYSAYEQWNKTLIEMSPVDTETPGDRYEWISRAWGDSVDCILWTSNHSGSGYMQGLPGEKLREVADHVITDLSFDKYDITNFCRNWPDSDKQDNTQSFYSHGTGHLISALIQKAYDNGENDFKLKVPNHYRYICNGVHGTSKEPLKISLEGSIRNGLLGVKHVNAEFLSDASSVGYEVENSTFTFHAQAKYCANDAKDSTFTFHAAAESCANNARNCSFYFLGTTEKMPLGLNEPMMCRNTRRCNFYTAAGLEIFDFILFEEALTNKVYKINPDGSTTRHRKRTPLFIAGNLLNRGTGYCLQKIFGGTNFHP